MGVAINYAKVFRVKNNVINILEQHQFSMDDSATATILENVDNYLEGVPYNINGNTSAAENCASSIGRSGMLGFDRNVVSNASSYAVLTQRGVCITQLGDDDKPYYKVTAYISIAFPFFDLYFTFPISGETKIISI